MARRMNPWLGWVLALAVAAGFSSLGFWQLGRAQQKETMLADSKRVLAGRVPKALALAGDVTRAQTFDWAEGEGEFSSRVLLDNQQRNGRAGVRAYRLFKPTDAPALLVDLGWLPLPADRTMPILSDLHGTLPVRGLLAPPPAHGVGNANAVLLPDTIVPTILTVRMDAPNLANLVGVDQLPPRVLRLDPELGYGYVRDLDILPNTMPPERHIAYAVQWFGLALAVLATAALLTFRRRRSGRAKMTA